jgi:hypothetical protein
LAGDRNHRPAFISEKGREQPRIPGRLSMRPSHAHLHELRLVGRSSLTRESLANGNSPPLLCGGQSNPSANGRSSKPMYNLSNPAACDCPKKAGGAQARAAHANVLRRNCRFEPVYEKDQARECLHECGLTILGPSDVRQSAEINNYTYV